MSALHMGFPEILADVVVRSTILVAITACACLVIRGSSASIRHLVWFAGLSGALLLPVLTAFLPAVRMPVPAYVAGITGGVTESSLAEPGTSVLATPAASTAGDALSTAAEVPGTRAGWGASLLLLWGAGTFVLVLRLIIGVTHVRRLSRDAITVEDVAWLQLSSDLARRMGVRRDVTLLTGSEGSVPMTWGIIRPVVWLPVAAEQWTAEHLRDVLAHELAHIRRRDALTRWIGHIAAVVYWFNPLVWLAVHRLEEESEHACDNAVLTLGASSVSYAEHLLKVVRSAGRKSSPSAAMAMARASGIEQRVRAILDPSLRRDPAARERGARVLFAAAFVLLPLATLQPVAAAPQPLGPVTASTGLQPLAAVVARAPEQNAESANPTSVDGMARPEIAPPAPTAAADASQVPDSSPPTLPSSGIREVSESAERYVAVTEEFGGSTASRSASGSSSASSSSSVSSEASSSSSR